MRALRENAFFRILLGEQIIASSLSVVLIPLVMLSNTAASAGLILLHGAILWVLVPLVVAPLTLAAARLSNSNGAVGLFADLGLHLIGLVAAVLLMIPILSWVTALPTRLFWSKPLLAGILPLGAAYCIWILSRYYRRERLKAATLDKERAQQALSALTAQIKPHFLFNALTSLEQLIDVSPAKAKSGIARLAGLYRRLLDASKQTYFCAADEIDLAAGYLEIQQIRFGDRLRVDISADPGVRGRKVPATLLLTLAENAVKHGIEPSLAGGTVSISMTEEEGGVDIVVMNPKSDRPSDTSTGHGLLDLRERLALLYGGRAHFSLFEKEDAVVAHVSIPTEPENEGKT